MSTELYASKHTVKIGDTTVIILQERHGKGPAFVHLHQNEKTALRAARAVIRSRGGSVLTLQHGGDRNIRFTLHKKCYEFDPNRIFTDAGIRHTLNIYGDYTPAAHRAVKKLANKIKALLPRGKVIAVHNNESYSLRDYLPGHTLAREARLVNINKHHHFRNFYVVTRKSEYKRLAKLHFNSVWQAHDAIDDGSLSVFLAYRNYVNVEAGYDKLAAQIQMLQHV